MGDPTLTFDTRSVTKLVVAARVFLYEDQSQESVNAFNKALEAFAVSIPWDDYQTPQIPLRQDHRAFPHITKVILGAVTDSGGINRLERETLVLEKLDYHFSSDGVYYDDLKRLDDWFANLSKTDLEQAISGEEVSIKKLFESAPNLPNTTAYDFIEAVYKSCCQPTVQDNTNWSLIDTVESLISQCQDQQGDRIGDFFGKPRILQLAAEIVAEVNTWTRQTDLDVSTYPVPTITSKSIIDFITKRCDSLIEGGHLGESTTEKIARQRLNETIDLVKKTLISTVDPS